LGTVTVSQDTTGSLDGTSGADIIVGGNAIATLIGNAGDDILLGGTGNTDVYQFGLDDGMDLIRDAGGNNDSISIVTTLPTDSTIISNLNFERVGTDLVINVGATQITVDDHYVAANSVESIRFTNGGTVYGYALSSNSYSLSTDNATPLEGSNQRDVIASSSGAEALNGNNGNDLLFGNGGVDTINGGSGNDLMVGGAGDDRLSGGTGNDVLVGGTGSDTFVFANSGISDADRVYDFNASGTAGSGDFIELSDAVFSLIGSSGSTLSGSEFGSSNGSGASATFGSGVHVIYDSATGNLFYDSDGGSSANRSLIATFATLPTDTFDFNDIKVGP
jgi:Ca2+-binding RTX toxin-like protein